MGRGRGRSGGTGKKGAWCRHGNAEVQVPLGEGGCECGEEGGSESVREEERKREGGSLWGGGGSLGGPAHWAWPVPPLWAGPGRGRERAGEGGTRELKGADGRLTVNKS